MKKLIITDDQNKLLVYTMIYLFTTVVLLIASANFYTLGKYLLFIFAVTGMWFSVKSMCKYGKRWIKKTPVCEFRNHEVVLHSLPDENNTMKYSEIKEVKILCDKKSVKLFFSGNHVKHPSGWNYVGIVYSFKRKELDHVLKQVKNCLDSHHVNYCVVDKN